MLIFGRLYLFCKVKLNFRLFEISFWMNSFGVGGYYFNLLIEYVGVYIIVFCKIVSMIVLFFFHSGIL